MAQAVCVLVVVLCAFSAVVRFINARRTRSLESHAHQELLDRPIEPQIRRTSSVNFGVRALDSNETPVEAGIVDSESLRTLSPISPPSRWSRISSPISAGGQRSSGSTSISNADGDEQDGLLHPPRPPFVSGGRFSGTRGTPTLPPQEGLIAGPSSGRRYIARRPLSAGYSNTSTPTGSRGHSRSASYTGSFDDASSPPSQYLQVPGSPRPMSADSASSIAGPPSLRPTPSPRPLKGILKNRKYSQSDYMDQEANRRSNTVFGVSPPNNKEPYSPELLPMKPDFTNLRSATPMPKSRPGYGSPHHSHNLSDIPEVPGQDPIELKQRRVSYADETVPGTSPPYAIPHPTRAPPAIPFLQSPSPAPDATASVPQTTTASSTYMTPPVIPQRKSVPGTAPDKI
ncbi:hypothetical protein ABW21_db0202036 [Orbilia brochopaga]|nr:hypothetical protein ABW21_db0202036 [Drechslerella brochopaga]